ncbi:MAG: alpha/beta hydrolase fold domain-containing protein [Burkholderiales bacterium]
MPQCSGASGKIAASAAARTALDGDTLLMGTNSTHGANPGPIAVAGDSAGGCLAAVTALRIRDEKVSAMPLVWPGRAFR